MEFKLVPKTWRNLVVPNRKLDGGRRYKKFPTDPIHVALLAGETIFILEKLSKSDRKAKLARYYRYATNRGLELHTHTYYEVETDTYGLLMWMD